MQLLNTFLIANLLTFNPSNLVNALSPKFADRMDTKSSKASHNILANQALPTELVLNVRAIRTANTLGSGWVGHIIPSAAIYPVLIGAQIFGKFYGIMAEQASGVWTATTPTNFYTISVGYIKLYIWSEDSAVQIGWNFVHSFAAMMLSATHRGFVGLLDATFVHVVSGITVHVKLIIAGRVGN